MRALLCRAIGENPELRVEEVAERSLRAHEVRIAVKAAGLNYPDVLMITGRYQVKPELPFTPGLEAAGEVVELGANVSSFALGQRVLALTRRGGCFATELAVDSDRVVPIPDSMDYVTAACFPMVYGTAHFALTHRGALQAGETLVITGAAGGVGMAAVQVGKRLGAHVIAAASSASRLAIAKQCGADDLIDYGREDLNERIKAITNGAGADVVLDTIGGDVFDSCVRAMNWEGRLLVVGFASGRIPHVPANLILVKNYSVIGVVFGAQTERDPRGSKRRLAELLDWYAEGKLRPHPAMTFPLDRAAEALHQLAGHRVTGKLSLIMDLSHPKIQSMYVPKASTCWG
jgi:NADPH2:quinone reductase